MKIFIRAIRVIRGQEIQSMRRVALIAVFITVLLLVLVGGHWYLAERFVFAPALPEPWRGAVLAVLATACLLLILQPVAERVLAPASARWIAWPAALWMGFAFLLLMLSFAADLAQALSGTVGVAASRLWAGAIGAVALVAGAQAVRTALREPTLERRELYLPRWPAALDGFRIVQISDLHLGPILDRRFAARLVQRCNALRPDLVAITGDLVDGNVIRVADEVQPFAQLQAAHGVFFVTGNHDYYSGADAWVERVERLGIRALRNQHVTIGQDGAAFDLAGVEDHHAHLVSSTRREDLNAALAGRDVQRAVVLLAHDPLTFRSAARLGVDLQLSGHTHGGQIWPFRYLVRLSTPFVVGHYRRDASQLYVSRGTGFWGPVMRLFAPGEIAEIVIRSRSPGLRAG
jgi:predicted MPP superfamily phosphohydrolase